MNKFLLSIMTHWYKFHEIILNLWAGRTLKPSFWGSKVGPEGDLTVITTHKCSKTNENHIRIGFYDQL